MEESGELDYRRSRVLGLAQPRRLYGLETEEYPGIYGKRQEDGTVMDDGIGRFDSES
jgi:hypothetical protein